MTPIRHSALLSSLLALAAVQCVAGAAPAGRVVQSLAGKWRFELDAQDKGIDAGWFKRSLTDSVSLPGTTDTNQKGNKNDSPNAGHLSRRWTDTGKAWYQRDIDIPETWTGKRVALFLERTRVSRVWLDDAEAGARHVRLTVPHVYDLTGLASPGRHRLTILVDNAQRLPAGGHLVSEDTQTNWNGILGRIELIATGHVWMQSIRVTPDLKRRVAAVKILLRNAGGRAFTGAIALRAESFNTARSDTASASQAVRAPAAEQTLDIDLPMGAGMLTWDEFEPALYRLTATLTPAGAQEIADRVTVEFGMREFGHTDAQLVVNGKKIMLRGRHDAGVFPLTGFPPMDLDAWLRYFRILKSYGLNHVRFHTWCPPEAAFLAADREGFYLSPELPLWGALPDPKVPDRIPFLMEEGRAILDSFGNSPSFCIFMLGNEPGGERSTMAQMIRDFRAYDARHAYSSGASPFFWAPKQQEGDDLWVTMRTRLGEAGRTRGSFSSVDLPLGHIETEPASAQYDYTSAIQGVTIPVIGHEVGQYQVFPNFDEIPKYTGVLEARNLSAMRDRLAKAGMLDQWQDFRRATGALAVRGYREEIETALRTPGFGGFQLLDLQDYPGQGTALVGILDAFMDSKGLITPERWREFCGPTVPLLRFDRYIWTTAETFAARALLSHYGAAGIPELSVEWTLRDAAGKILRSGQLPSVRVAQGALADLGQVTIPLADLPAPARYEVVLSAPGTDFRNRYPVWVFHPSIDNPIPRGVTVSHALDAETRSKLDGGGTVLLFPQLKDPATSIEIFFMTDFWCYSMFKSIAESRHMAPSPGTMGLLMNPAHPALREFPTGTHSDWQWWRLVKNGRALILDRTPAGYRPVIQVIDNAFRDHKLGLVIETRFGSGKLLICGVDLPRLQDRPEARQLLHSLLRYVASPEFNPGFSLGQAQVLQLLGVTD